MSHNKNNPGGEGGGTPSYRYVPPVGLSVGISVTVSIPSNEVRVVIVLTKNVVKIMSLVL